MYAHHAGHVRRNITNTSLADIENIAVSSPAAAKETALELSAKPERRPLDDEGHDATAPTEEEKKTLRRVAGKIPRVAYYICAVEFAERASYYGVKPLFGNFVNRPLPAGGNGYGSPPRGKAGGTGGALGLGTVIATAVAQSFSMLVYALPVFFGWMADSRTGRWSLICWGIAVCGVAHVLMVGAGAKTLLEAGRAVAPFMISVYVLAIGAGKELSMCLCDILIPAQLCSSPISRRYCWIRCLSPFPW